MEGRRTGLSVAKTKAHRSRAEAERSDEDPLANWLGNNAADAHAKDLCLAAARGDPRWAACCDTRAQALAWLSHVGIAAAWCFQNWPAAQRSKKMKSSQVPGRRGVDVRHELQQDSAGRLQCRICFARARTTVGLERLRKRPCAGSLASRAHSSHTLFATHGLTWCSKCGAHAKRVPRALRRPCVGAPRSESYANTLRRLRDGLPLRSIEGLSVSSAEPVKPLRQRATGEASAQQPAKITSCAGVRQERPATVAAAPSVLQQGLCAGLDVCTDRPASSATVTTGLRRVSCAGAESCTDRLASPAFAATGLQQASCTDSGDAVCTADLGEAWSRRIVCLPTAGHEVCRKCGVITRVRCQACMAALCLPCATAKRPC